MRIATTLPPGALLEAISRIEDAEGRQRPFLNAPRTLDIDLLLYGDVVRDEPWLTIPHPRLAQRGFGFGRMIRCRREPPQQNTLFLINAQHADRLSGQFP